MDPECGVLNPEREKRDRRIVMLTVTENCNLDCVYCYEHNKTKTFMDLRLAKEIIEHEFANSTGFHEMEFHLFGGEPTLRTEFITELVEWTIAKNFGKPFLFFLQTNGTLVHGAFQDWLVRHKKYVFVGLSLDGTPVTHNHNRSGSYEKIDMNFFLAHYKEQGARMTINKDTVGHLSSDVIHLHNLGFQRIDTFFACGIDWDSDSEGALELLERELRKLCEFYLENPLVNECSLFDMRLPRILYSKDKVEKWCGVGTHIVSVAVDGKRYPCQTFQPNSNPKPIQAGEIDFKAITDFDDPECSGCTIASLCPNCYGMNYMKSGDLTKRDKSTCEITKMRALAVSYLRGMQITRHAKKMTPPELYQNIKAVQLVQRMEAGKAGKQ